MPAPMFECFLCGHMRPITERRELDFVMLGPAGRNLLGSSSFNSTYWQVEGGTPVRDSQGSFPSKRRRRLLENNTFKTIKPIVSLDAGARCWTEVQIADPGEWALNGDLGVNGGVQDFTVSVTLTPPGALVASANLARVGGSRSVQLLFAVPSVPATCRVEVSTSGGTDRWWFDCFQLRKPEDEFIYTTAGPLFFPKRKEVRAKVEACSWCYDEEISA